jgi:exonuclease III
MMNNRIWHILCWNVRGINGSDKWDAVRDKIEESCCSVICLQETKHEHFDMRFIRNFAPRRFDHFEYIPSVGASGGILVVWNSSTFKGTVLGKAKFWHYSPVQIST